MRALPPGLRAVLGIARLRPFDPVTAEGRSRERYRRIALTSVSSVGLRAISLMVKFAIVPLAAGYLGDERYGLLLTITSIAAWFTLADLGMGNGLRNLVAEAQGRDDQAAARQYVSSASWVLFLLAATIAFGFAAVHSVVPWDRVFNVGSAQAIAEVGPSVAIFVGCMLLGVPLSIGVQTNLGCQDGFVTNLWDTAGSVLGLVGVVVVTQLELGLPWLVLVVAGSPLAALVVNNVALFGRRRPWLRPRLRDVRGEAMKRIAGTGILFFGLQVGATVVMFTDTIVVAQLFGAAEVPHYAIPWQLFSALAVMAGLVLTPFWPAYTEAVARGDAGWAIRSLRRSFVLGLGITVPGAALLVALAPAIIGVWVGPEFSPPFLLLIAFGLIVVVVGGLGGPLAMFLNGLGILKLQLGWVLAAATANLVLSIVLGRAAGPAGVAFATVIAELLFGVLPFVYYVPRLIRSMGTPEPATDAPANRTTPAGA